MQTAGRKISSVFFLTSMNTLTRNSLTICTLTIDKRRNNLFPKILLVTFELKGSWTTGNSTF